MQKGLLEPAAFAMCPAARSWNDQHIVQAVEQPLVVGEQRLVLHRTAGGVVIDASCAVMGSQAAFL